MHFSERALSIKPSATLELDARTKEMVRSGIDVISFGAGEPDFDTPGFICDAGVEAIRKGITRYTPVAGLLPLREAVCAKMWNDHGLSYNPNQVLVSCGAKHSLYNALQVLCSPGDEVIVPSPYWVSYVEQIRMAGGVPVIVATREQDGFRLQPEALKGAITPRTRLLMLNSPSNPSGTVYSRRELEAIADFILAHDITVISDEIYEKLVYDDTCHVSIAQLGDEIKNRTIVINGVSKTYAMTGWRIGYAVGPADAIGLMCNLQSHSSSNATSISQYASIAALIGPQDEIVKMRSEFARRRNRMVERLQRMSGVSCRKPEGAFYTFASIEGLIGCSLHGTTVQSGDDLARMLLEKAHVTVVPGSSFGMPSYIRLSYATSMESIEQGMNRIEEFLGGASVKAEGEAV